MKIPVDTCNYGDIFSIWVNVLVHYDAHHCLDQYDFDKKTKSPDQPGRLSKFRLG